VTQERYKQRLEENRQWRAKNREKLAAARLKHREKRLASTREWRARKKLDPDWVARRNRETIERHRRKKITDPAYRARIKKRSANYHKKIMGDPVRRAELRANILRRYYQIKADPVRYAKYREAERIRRAKRKQRDPHFALKCHLRQRLSHLVKRGQAVKTAKAVTLVGCTLEELRRHIERQFKRGMSWANYGRVWHIDHIIPCAKFDLTDERQQRLCFHYLNLCPLRAEENMRKNSRLLAPAQLPLLLPAS
jgi:hypothetical protein